VAQEILQQIREEMQRAYRPGERGEHLRTERTEPAGLQSTLAALRSSYALVGQLPPEPPTLRGRMGARLVRLVQRLLFWYTPQIVHFQYAALQAFEEQARSLEEAARREAATRESLEAHVRQLQGALEEQRQQNQALRSELERRLESESARAESEREPLVHGLRRLERDLLRLKPLQIAQERRIALLLEEARQRWPEPFDAAQMQRLCEEQQHNLDAFYMALEDEFRGGREDIKERLGVYLPKLMEAGIGTAAMPILDVGCGRGEWLELLRERQLQALGVDSNRAMIADCQERGLEVVEADAIAYLSGLPSGSVGAVTGFHLIEHLPLARLFDLLDAAVRALKPGGAAIFETPNPNNVFVSTRYFYLDPTHRHPIPPQLAQLLAEARGLRRVEILELHPWPQSHWLDTRTGGEVAARFNECFYGPQDYAVIGWKV
jgi:SAM-dependent methyltransferase